jgi:hypothetical protein
VKAFCVSEAFLSVDDTRAHTSSRVCHSPLTLIDTSAPINSTMHPASSSLETICQHVVISVSSRPLARTPSSDEVTKINYFLSITSSTEFIMGVQDFYKMFFSGKRVSSDSPIEGFVVRRLEEKIFPFRDLIEFGGPRACDGSLHALKFGLWRC